MNDQSTPVPDQSEVKCPRCKGIAGRRNIEWRPSADGGPRGCPECASTEGLHLRFSERKLLAQARGSDAYFAPELVEVLGRLGRLRAELERERADAWEALDGENVKELRRLAVGMASALDGVLDATPEEMQANCGERWTNAHAALARYRFATEHAIDKARDKQEADRA
jgi:hypothetical protein